MLPLLLAAALQMTATPPAEEPGERVFLEQPQGGDFASVYPQRAMVQEVAGAALLSCVIGSEGRLHDCAVVRERPNGFGFGAAAQRMVPRFKLAEAAGHKVALPFVFSIDGRSAMDFSGRLTDSALLLEPAASGGPGMAPCPSPAQPARTCTAHLLHWAQQPAPRSMASVVALAGDARNVTTAICSVDDDASLDDCRLDAATTAGEQDALNRLLPYLRAPAAADDGSPVAGKQIALKVDWAVLRAVEADPLFGRGVLATVKPFTR